MPSARQSGKTAVLREGEHASSDADLSRSLSQPADALTAFSPPRHRNPQILLRLRPLLRSVARLRRYAGTRHPRLYRSPTRVCEPDYLA